MKNSALSFDASMRGNATNQRVPCANAFCRERTPADDIRRFLSPLFFFFCFSLIKSIRIHFLHFLHQLHLSILFFTSFFFCCLPIFLHPKKTICRKRLCIIVSFFSRRIGECISVDLPRPFYLCFVCLEQFPTLAMFLLLLLKLFELLVF